MTGKTGDPTSWHSYPSVYALGHRYVSDLLQDPVTVEEKIDGSQFSFGVFGGVYRMRSKGVQLELSAPTSMFVPAVEMVYGLPLHDGWTYRGEFLGKPHHNALSYGRRPAKGVILFDINPAEESYLSYENKRQEAERLGLEIVPLLHEGMLSDIEMLRGLLERESCLGGTKIEGVVVKNYARFGKDKKALMGKFVSEAYKETHEKEWKKSNPTGGDLVGILCATYKTEARWEKAVQHLRDAGKLDDSPRDIGLLMREVPADILKECGDEIKEKLMKWAWGRISRSVVGGLPQWYKQRLLDRQFAQDETLGP